MGMLGQHRKRSGRSSVSSEAKKDIAKLHEKEIRPLKSVKLNQPAFQIRSPKKEASSHRNWNPLRQQPKPSASPKIRQNVTHLFFNHNDVVIPTTEEWNNEEDDDVALLATPVPTFVETFFSHANEGGNFEVTSPLSTSSFASIDTSGSPSYSTFGPSVTSNKSTEKSMHIWNKVPLLKCRKNVLQESSPSNKKKKENRKDEDEIRFECFFEEDEENVENDWYNSLPRNNGTSTPSKASLFRRTSVMQSWWTQALGTVKRSCRIPRSDRCRSPTTTPLGDEDSQIITFVSLQIQESGGTKHSNEFGNSSEEESSAIRRRNNMYLEAPIQFQIPVAFEPSSWEEQERFPCFSDVLDRQDTSTVGVSLV